MPDIPHFDYPFRIARGSAVTVEQDTIEEIVNCVLAIMKTPRGFRIELPEFGVREQTFTENGPSRNEIQRAIEVWEDRARTTIDSGTLDQLAYTVSIQVQERLNA